jgi:hypothetical protein
MRLEQLQEFAEFAVIGGAEHEHGFTADRPAVGARRSAAAGRRA